MLSNGRLLELRDQIVADFKAFLPEIREIETHFGPFDLDELKNFSVKAPAIRVSILGWNPTKNVATRELDCDVHVAAYIVTKSTATVEADVRALDIAEALAGLLSARPFTQWSEPATHIGAANHYSGKVREVSGAIALFSVDWHTIVRIGKDVTRDRYGDPGPSAPSVEELSVILNGEEYVVGGEP